jgi:hypothetical protein
MGMEQGRRREVAIGAGHAAGQNRAVGVAVGVEVPVSVARRDPPWRGGIRAIPWRSVCPDTVSTDHSCAASVRNCSTRVRWGAVGWRCKKRVASRTTRARSPFAARTSIAITSASGTSLPFGNSCR